MSEPSKLALAKNAESLFPSFRPKELHVPCRPGFSALNPSIAVQNNEIQCIIRSLHFSGNDENWTARNENHFCKISPDLDVVSSEIIVPADIRAKTDSGTKGHEDCRLFWWRNEWWASATVRDRHPQGRCEIAIFNLAGTKEHVFAPVSPGLMRTIQKGDPAFIGSGHAGSPSGHEKNWMPFVVPALAGQIDGDRLFFVYSFEPTIVLAVNCDCDSYTLVHKTKNKCRFNLLSLRGGSQCIALPGGRWLLLGHEVFFFSNGIRKYLHRFVELDAKFRVSRVSDLFFFIRSSIEFCAGMALLGKDLLLSFGVEDKQAFLARLQLSDVEKCLHGPDKTGIVSPGSAGTKRIPKRASLPVLPVQIAIATVSRPYLTKTLESLWASSFQESVTLFVGSPDEAYLNSLRRDPAPPNGGMSIKSMPQKLWSEIKDLPSRQKAVANFLRIFESEDADILVCEDDVEFSPDWLLALTKIKEQNPDDLIWLYSMKNRQPNELGYVSSPSAWGACGVFYPRHHRRKIAQFIRQRMTNPSILNRWRTEEGEEWLLGPGVVDIDQLLQSYLFYENGRAIVSVPSLIDHVGAITTLEGNEAQGPRHAPTFRKPKNMNKESNYTAPRPDCPRPDWWHSDDVDSTEHEVSELVAGFIRALQPELVVETGTAWGATAEAIGKALRANGHGRLISLEIDAERVAHSRKRCVDLPVDILQQSSLEFRPTETIGFAWFDSLFHLRIAEFHHLRPFLSPGAIIGFHDTGPQHPLRPSVEALKSEGLDIFFLPTPRGVAFGQLRSR